MAFEHCIVLRDEHGNVTGFRHKTRREMRRMNTFVLVRRTYWIPQQRRVGDYEWVDIDPVRAIRECVSADS